MYLIQFDESDLLSIAHSDENGFHNMVHRFNSFFIGSTQTGFHTAVVE